MGRHLDAWSNGNGAVQIAMYGGTATVSLEDARKFLSQLEEAVRTAEAVDRSMRERFAKERSGT